MSTETGSDQCIAIWLDHCKHCCVLRFVTGIPVMIACLPLWHTLEVILLYQLVLAAIYLSEKKETLFYTSVVCIGILKKGK